MYAYVVTTRPVGASTQSQLGKEVGWGGGGVCVWGGGRGGGFPLSKGAPSPACPDASAASLFVCGPVFPETTPNQPKKLDLSQSVLLLLSKVELCPH